MVVNSSGNQVGVMCGSAERVLCSLGMPGMLNGNESQCSEGWAESFFPGLHESFMLILCAGA